MYDARMPFRASRAVVWLAFALSTSAHAAVLRDHLYGVKALTKSDAIAVGNYGAIYLTANGGKSWEARDSGTKVPLFSVDFADATTGWAVGRSADIDRKIGADPSGLTIGSSAATASAAMRVASAMSVMLRPKARSVPLPPRFDPDEG